MVEKRGSKIGESNRSIFLIPASHCLAVCVCVCACVHSGTRSGKRLTRTARTYAEDCVCFFYEFDLKAKWANFGERDSEPRSYPLRAGRKSEKE